LAGGVERPASALQPLLQPSDIRLEQLDAQLQVLDLGAERSDIG